jgi:HK97 family phage prohead protease
MPYFITDQAQGCDGWATIKDDGEVIGCHTTKQAAIDQMVAVSIAEGLEPGGERADAPAPPSDQIQGSDENEPGSAGGKTGNITLDDATETALSRKATEHNDAMAERDRPAWTRVRLGALRSVYRRGAGAYSTSHRPGVTRGAWAMARVNAFLFLARTGRPETPAYIGDNDLLHPDHPRYSGSRTVEVRQVSVPEYVRDAAARGLELRREGFGGDGLTDQTIREARLMADGEMSDSKVVRANAWAARHAVDLDAPANRDPDHPQWPGAGAVAHYLWGIDPLDPGPARRWLERQAEMLQEDRALPDNYRPALSPDVPEGRACGNCRFYNEAMVQGDKAWCERWDDYVRGDYYCNAWQADERATDMSKVEFRTFGAEITEMRQAETGDGMTFGGYAWKYDVPSLPLGHGFTERIAPGTFTRSLKSRVDIRAYVNHNDELLLGSTRAKTLRIEDRAEGGYVEIDLPDTTAGRDIRTLVARGDITGMSFGFSTVKDSWSDDGTERTLMAAKLHEVSVVTGVPAYPQTTASVRKLQTLATRTATDVDELSDAMTALQAGELTEDQAHLLRSVVDKVAPAPDPAVPTAILAAKLALAEKALGL